MKMKTSKPFFRGNPETHGKPFFRGIQGSKCLHREIRKSIIKWFNNATQGVVLKKPTISKNMIKTKKTM